MTDISIIPPPALPDSLEVHGDLDLSCILNDIFPDVPAIELDEFIVDPASSGTETDFQEKIISSPPPERTVARKVSDCSLVSDDEMSQNNNSPAHSPVRAEPRDSTAATKTKTKESAAVPEAVVSNRQATKPTKAASPSKKRSATEMEDDEDDVQPEPKQKVQRRERNREHAKKSRSRKKNLTKQLEEALEILREENKKLKSFVVARFGEKETAAKVKKAIVTPNDKLVAALQSPSNRVLSKSAISYFKSLGSDFQR